MVGSFKTKNPARAILIFCALVFLFNFFVHIDLGRFEPDYFQAHGITMRHLHQEGSFITLMQTIPNSASGVLPLYLYGFVEGLALHRLVSLLVFLAIIAVVYLKRKKEPFSMHFIGALLLSPMLVSSVNWVLPEVFALFLVIAIFAIPERLYFLSAPLSFFVPWARQTFITHLGNRIFFLPERGFKRIFLEGVFALLGIFSLYRIWGGLVPPNLAKVHLSPSFKAFAISILVFSLYFFYDNFKSVRAGFKAPIWRWVGAGALAAALAIANARAPELVGGGYIFSRIEHIDPVVAGVFEFSLYFFFFLVTDLRMIAVILVSALSFSTTNYFFLKYADFYIFAILAYGLTELKPQQRALYERYARSIFYFECVSLVLAYIFYKLMR